MSAVVEAPRDFVESLAELKIPPKTDALLQKLMDRNTEGQLSPTSATNLRPWWS